MSATVGGKTATAPVASTDGSNATATISGTALKAGTGRWREVHPAVWLVAVLFTLRYALE